MGKRFLCVMSVLVFIFAPDLHKATKGEPHPEIILIDYDGNEMKELTKERGTPTESLKK